MPKRKKSSASPPESTKRSKVGTSTEAAPAPFQDPSIDVAVDKVNESTAIHSGLSDYEMQRLKNIEQHAKLFESLQLGDARNALAAVGHKKQQLTQIGLKRPKREPPILEPLRVSLRLIGKRSSDPSSKPIKSYTPWEPEPVVDRSMRDRNPSGPIPLTTKNRTDEDQSKKFIDFLRSCHSKVETTKTVKAMGDLKRYGQLLQTLTLTDRRVAKVVPDRITALAIHSSSVSPIVAVGDKWGRLGVWQVGSRDGDDGVFLFEPHASPLSCLKYGVNQPELLFSASYDSTVRCMDINKEVFDEVFSLPEVEDVRFYGLSFISDDSKSFLISCSDGTVRVVDARTPNKMLSKHSLHGRSVKCVDVHPVAMNYFVTASTDRCVAVWDMRQLKGASSHVSEMHHFRQVDSAYFSSLTGDKIVSSSTDDTVKIFSFEDKKELKVLNSIKHDNQTGRWLTNFRPSWDPKRDDSFVIGSMKRPRQVEIWGSNGSLIASLQHELLNSVNSLNCFHTSENWLAGANSSGRVFVWM